MSGQAPRKTLVVLQPGYLPWLGYFDQLRRADVFAHYDDVQFDKHGWRNRNRIKTPTGPLWLTVPVRHHGQNKPKVNEIAIDGTSNWAKKHVASVKQYYARAPFVQRYLPELEELLHRPWPNLAELDIAIITVMAQWLHLTPPVVRTSELGIGGVQSERLIALCQHFGANCYLSGDAASDYLDVALFARHGIEVVWQQYQHPVYEQQHGEFVPYLSAIDLLFNCGDDSARILQGAPNE
jgi:hypothetical protein